MKFLYIDEMNLELFLRTQEEIFEFRELYGSKKVSIELGENAVLFVSETGATHELGTSESCSLFESLIDS